MTWHKVDTDLPAFRFSGKDVPAEEAYQATRHGGTWYLVLVDDVMRRWVLGLDGRARTFPIAASGRPIEVIFDLADAAIDAHRRLT